jgi:hypothetical protein
MRKIVLGKRRLVAVAIATIAIVAGGLVASQRPSYAASGIQNANVQELDGSIDFTGNTTAYKTTTHDTAIETSAPFDWSSLFTGCTSTADACAIGHGVPSDNGPISTNGAACQVGSCAGLIDDIAQPYNGDLFTQGSKDVQDVSAWTCSQQSNPPKDELVNTYASAWTAPPGTVGQVAPGDTLAFMGLERPNTKGDANAGFWLFKKSVLCNPATGKFVGAHSNGDVFLVGSFVGGGSSAVLNQYTWSCTQVSISDPTCANTNGSLVLNKTGALNCPDDAATTTFCQVTNQQIVNGTTTNWTVNTPWSNIDTGTAGIGGPGFLEIGIDLSQALGSQSAPAPCFASFLADTRSSGSSTQASTKDFINGSFPTCGNLSVKKYIDGNLDPNGPSGDIANGPDSSDATSNIPGFGVAVTNGSTNANLCTGTTSTTDGSLSCGTALNNIPNGTPINVTETVPAATPANAAPAPSTNPSPTYFNTDPGVVGAGDVSGLQGTTKTKAITMGPSSQTVYVGNECFVNFGFQITGVPTGTTAPSNITVSYSVTGGNYNGTGPGGSSAGSGSISLSASSTASTWTGMVQNFFVQNDTIHWTWTETPFNSTTASSAQTGGDVTLTSANGYPSCQGSATQGFPSTVLGGIKFKDANHNGVQDNYTDLNGNSVPEPLLAGFTMNLYPNSTCSAPALTTAVTTSTADPTTGFNYNFGSSFGPGNYSVSESTPLPTGWLQTAPRDASNNVVTCIPFTETLGDSKDGPLPIGNTPLSDITVTVTGQTTSTASNVICTSNSNPAGTTSDPGMVNTNTSTGLETGTYVCTVKIIDP